MKQLIFLICLLTVFLFAVVFSLRLLKGKIIQDFNKPVTTSIEASPSPTSASISSVETKSIFVPYWILPTKRLVFTDAMDSVIYFGVTPDKTGLNSSETGNKKLQSFLKQTKSYKKTLVLRMIDQEVNTALLANPAVQKRLALETATLAKQSAFSEVLLDLELSAIPLDSVITQINRFVKTMSSAVRKQHVAFSVAIYGDTFYRVRPYDIKSIAAVSDSLYLMSYDFHKARGNPGPNFPLHGRDTYGYDMEKMVDDFLRFVPGNKLTVVFGMYGYDWVVDKKGNMLKSANPMTTREIDAFLADCSSCKVIRDSSSAETKVTYTRNNESHVIWYEDTASVAKKKAFLKTKGINSFSYWAFSYY